MLGVAHALGTVGRGLVPRRVEGAALLATVWQSGRAVSAMLRTPPHPLLLSRMNRSLAHAAASALASRDPCLPGVQGPAAAALAFARRWAGVSSATAQVASRLRIYELRRVAPPPGTPGRLRVARESDVALVSRWLVSFAADARVAAPADRMAAARALVSERRLFLWDDEGPVSMAATTGATRHAIRINAVYTPPPRRGRGYATACVASLCQALLDSGTERCVLYADLSNETSNALYRRIGFRPVRDDVVIDFVPAGRGRDSIPRSKR